MKRCLAIWLALWLLTASVVSVSAHGDHVYDTACDGVCNVCGEVRLVAHDYRDTVVTPDCENSGYVVHTCAVCGDSYADGRVAALGHDYGLTAEVPPTCGADGAETYICQRCSDSYTAVVPATGRHTYSYGCDEKCNVCGYVRDDAHSYIFMGTVEPTCGEDGSDGYKCWDCGAVKYDLLPATGQHIYSGACDAVCNGCGQLREGVADHDYRLTAAVETTCVTDGTYTYTCFGCGDRYTDTVTATGHTYGIVITPPDCENDGYTTHTCAACGDVIVDNRVTALGHSYDDDLDADCNVCGSIREVPEKPVDIVYGDANGDGEVNNIDMAMLQQYINQWEVTLNEVTADANGDGEINNIDVALLQQYINQWDVVLGPQA